MPRISEPSFNVELGNVLRTKHPLSTDRIGVEQTGVLSEAANLRPDFASLSLIVRFLDRPSVELAGIAVVSGCTRQAATRLVSCRGGST